MTSQFRIIIAIIIIIIVWILANSSTLPCCPTEPARVLLAGEGREREREKWRLRLWKSETSHFSKAGKHFVSSSLRLEKVKWRMKAIISAGARAVKIMRASPRGVKNQFKFHETYVTRCSAAQHILCEIRKQGKKIRRMLHTETKTVIIVF